MGEENDREEACFIFIHILGSLFIIVSLLRK
jgi:hypothetical protein